MEKTNDLGYQVLRIASDALYDHMAVRIASANRVRSLVRRRLLGMGFDKEEKKAEDAEEEPKWTDEEMLEALNEAKKKNVLTESDIASLLDAWNLANQEKEVEKEYEKRLAPLTKLEPIYVDWLSHVKGVGTKSMSRLLSYYGYCEDFETVSKLWAYSGLAVVEGHAPKREKGKKLGYNNEIKTGVLGVIAKSLIMGRGVYKTKIYDVYKKRILARGCCDRDYKGSDSKKKGHKCREYPGHAERMAIRYMAKLFLQHYWLKCRQIKNLPIREPYALEKMDGHTTMIEPLIDE